MKKGGWRDMDRGRIVAYKRSWRENFVGRVDQTTLSATQPSFLCSGVHKSNNQERRSHDVDSIAYLRSKTVQPMGGSSCQAETNLKAAPTPLESNLPAG